MPPAVRSRSASPPARRAARCRRPRTHPTAARHGPAARRLLAAERSGLHRHRAPPDLPVRTARGADAAARPSAAPPPARSRGVDVTLDPTLSQIRHGLRARRRRLWLRRVVRDGTFSLAAVMGLELALALAARIVPLEWGRVAAAAIPLLGALALLVDAVRVRPTLGGHAPAADGEQGLRDR